MGRHERAEKLRDISDQTSKNQDFLNEAAKFIENDEWPEETIKEPDQSMEETITLLLARTEFLMNRIEELQRRPF